MANAFTRHRAAIFGRPAESGFTHGPTDGLVHRGHRDTDDEECSADAGHPDVAGP